MWRRFWLCLSSLNAPASRGYGCHPRTCILGPQLLLCVGVHTGRSVQRWSNSRQGLVKRARQCLPNTQIPRGLSRSFLPRVRADLQRQIAFTATAVIVVGFPNDGIRGSKDALVRSSKREPDVAVTVPSAEISTNTTRCQTPVSHPMCVLAAVTNSIHLISVRFLFFCFPNT